MFLGWLQVVVKFINLLFYIWPAFDLLLVTRKEALDFRPTSRHMGGSRGRNCLHHKGHGG